MGGTVVAREKVGEKDTDFSGVIAKIRPSNPDAVYYGGEYPAAGPLSKQIAGAGLNIPLMGGDGIVDAKFVELGGKEGDLATPSARPTESLARPRRSSTRTRRAVKEPFTAYGAFSYDAANVDHRCAWPRPSTARHVGRLEARTALTDAVQASRLDGASGEVEFDQYGDSTNKVLTVYQVTRQWKRRSDRHVTGELTTRH